MFTKALRPSRTLFPTEPHCSTFLLSEQSHILHCSHVWDLAEVLVQGMSNLTHSVRTELFFVSCRARGHCPGGDREQCHICGGRGQTGETAAAHG